MKITFAKATQMVVFMLFVFEFVAFQFGWIHVPPNAEDAKLFWMVFGILNTILSVQALSYAAQRDDGYPAPPPDPALPAAAETPAIADPAKRTRDTGVESPN